MPVLSLNRKLLVKACSSSLSPRSLDSCLIELPALLSRDSRLSNVPTVLFRSKRSTLSSSSTNKRLPDGMSPPRSLRVAVVGCSHGTLDDIYASVERCDQEARKRGEPETDLMICCGDFQASLPLSLGAGLKGTDTRHDPGQAMRNTADLQTMACPVKYRALGHFHQYYAGTKKAPKLTIVIGGNHESSGYMWEW